jgi:hypothetical protein
VANNIDGKKGFTYPNPMILNQGTHKTKLTLFWRGGSWKPTFAHVPGFTGYVSKNPEDWQWQDSIELYVGKAARPYIKYEHEPVHGVDNTPHDKIHMAFTDGHPRDVPTNSIYYACIQDELLKKGVQFSY